MKKATLYLLSIFSFLVTYPQEAKVLNIIGKPKKLVTGEMVARRDANGNYCAALQVISNQDGFTYDSFDGIVGNIDDKPGMDMVYLTSTERVLQVFKTGFKPLKIILSDYGIVLKPREVWQIEINGEGGAESLPVTIRITPNDASLSIDGMVVAASYTQRLSIGQHSINIAKDGFQTIEKTITVDDKNVFFEWTLEKTQTQWLVITSKPDGADLYINDQAVGKTPYQKELAVGKYTFRVQKELYLSSIGVVELDAGTQKQKIEVNLKANYGTLNVRTEPEVNAEVFMNGMSINKITPCQIEKVPSGEKTIWATKNFYQITEQIVTVSPESNLQVVLNSKPTFGTISINSTPESGAIVSIDGLSTGKTTPCTIEKVPAGEHAITVSFEMYETITQRFTLVAGETKPLIINMNPTFAVITLNTEPTAEIYINGELKTNGKWQGRLSPGIYTFEAKLDKHITAIEKQSITIGQPINLTLRPMPKTGNLRIMSIPIEANIKIDSKDVGQTPITIKNMLIGDYSIELSLTGYATTKEQATITEGHTFEINDILSAVTMPSVSTQSVTEIKQTTAISGGNIISDGGSKVSAKGVCWSENEIPTTDDAHSNEGSGSNSFSSGLFNLTPNSTYNVRAYATNSEGTTYGDVVDFKTLNDGMKIQIKSKPSGANLFIDAVSYGKTPYVGYLKYGNHKIKIENKRKKIEKNILISQGGNTSFTLEFEDNPDMEIETYCSGPEFQSNKDFFRANAISESMDQQVSRQKALTLARVLIAQQLQVTLKNVTDAYVNSTSHNTVEYLGQRYEGLTREVTNQKLLETRTICEKTTRTQAGNFKTYVALELSGAEVLGAMKAKISTDEKLHIDYDYEKFKKSFEDEMGKME